MNATTGSLLRKYTNTGKFKQVLATISKAAPTQASSFCPICKKYFLMVEEEGQFVYVAVNSTDGGVSAGEHR